MSDELMGTPAEERDVLMRVIVGSKAHGLARSDSDPRAVARRQHLTIVEPEAAR